MPPDTWDVGLLAQLALLPAIVGDVRGDTPRLLNSKVTRLVISTGTVRAFVDLGLAPDTGT